MNTYLQIIKNNKFKIILSILFIGLLSILMYIKYVRPKFNPNYVTNNEFVSTDKKNIQEVNMILFYTTWCPHSKKAMNIWKTFKSEYHSKEINKFKLLVSEVDCDKDESTADKYNITGYPTIKLIKSNDEIVEFDAKPNIENLQEFIKATLY